MSVEILAEPLLSLLLGYALGSIPFGILLTRLSGAGDLRAIGSGNIGATNVLRTGRKGLAALTLLLDMLKGTAAVLVAGALFPSSGAEIAAIGAMLGHMWPAWLHFKGGKGVATFFGVIAGLDIFYGTWALSAVYAAAWLGTLAVTRYSSVGGMTAALSAPVGAALLGRFDLALLYLGFALLVLWKHRANLDRLLSGEEPRVGGGKSDVSNA